MINGKELYDVVAALVPLYVPMILAYVAVWWWKIFSPEQCSGINRFVAMFAVPFLTFQFLSSNNPYAMNFRFLAADTLQKVVILGAFLLWSTFTKCGSLDWTLTLFSLSSLPNTLIVGIPLLTAMYGDSSASLMTQIVVMQGAVWFTLLLFLYEYIAAKRLISMQFPENGASINSITVHSDVSSLNDKETLQADAQRENGELHVVVRSSSLNNSCNRSSCWVHSSMQRASSFNTTRDLQKEGFQDTSKTHEEKIHRMDVNDLLNTVKHESIDMSPSPKAIGDREVEIQYHLREGLKEVKIEEGDASKKQQMPRASVMTRLVLTMVWRNLVRNPNTYASFFGIAWSLVSFKWNIKMPSIVDGSILILSKTATGMAMFSMACGKTWTAISMVARLLVGPAVIAGTAIVIGIRGVLLRVAIVQAAIPQSIVTFVFAKEYNLHADILSTAVIFGTVVSLPVTIIYFVLLGL
ncbi:Auxin efflux carrier component 2, partial [Mucuna pruriens]